MTDDTLKSLSGLGAMVQVAATMMRTAFGIPIEAMRTACDVQERAIELMESLIPGLNGERGKTSHQMAPPPAAGASAAAAAAPSAGAAGAPAGWGPVTPQASSSGWGPMGGTPRPANGSPNGRVSSGQPANSGAAADTLLSQLGQGLLSGPPWPANASGAPSREGGLQVLVIFKVFHIVDPVQLQRTVTETHSQLSRIFASGAVLASGAFAVGRGGFFLLSVGSCEELLTLMAPGLNDNCTLEIWPVLPFAQQLAVFQEIERMGLMKL